MLTVVMRWAKWDASMFILVAILRTTLQRWVAVCAPGVLVQMYDPTLGQRQPIVFCLGEML